MKRLSWCAAGLSALLLALPAPAYYHFIYYLNGLNAPEKFDLTALPNKTVTFFVSENGPSTYAGTDTLNSVLSQLRQATTVWNGVASSDLRVAFGGLENIATLQNTLGGDVVFEDLPPGLLGYGGPTSLASPVLSSGGAPFVPILRSTVHLNLNLSMAPGPSYDETFFMTVVHEMGHALGLQHTFTSATMSQATTRATTLSHPLDVDDVAGISVLYPNALFAQFGSITGRITSGGKGLHLTSVVAIRAGGGAVSGITNQDGTYRIDGIPPGQYFVYAHPLPPDADINGPWNADGSVAPASGPTNALFYPSTTSLAKAAPISVQPAQTVSGINISLSNRPSVEIYDAGVYGFFNDSSVAVKPAYVDMLAGPSTVVAAGVGLGANGKAPGLNVQFLGGSARIAPNGIQPYAANGYTYIALALGFNLGASSGPQHLVFTTSDFMHVLPAGIIATLKPPPSVSSVLPNGDGTVTVTGLNWNPDSLIYFDGLPAVVFALDAVNGIAVVTPPAGASGQTAVVTVYNTDGQNSQFIQSTSPVTYPYGDSAPSLVTSVSPGSLPAGTEALVDITTAGFSFVPGQVALGFGTTDIVVRRIYVLGPNHLQADVSVVAGAALSNPDISVFSGFQIATAPAGFQITPAVAGLPTVIPVLTNVFPGLNGAYAGATVSFSGWNLTAPNAIPIVTLGGQAAPVLSASATQLVIQLPAVLAAGPAVLSINNGALTSYPVLVDIDPPPAQIIAVSDSAGNPLTSTYPAHPGDMVLVDLAGFATPGTTIDSSRVQASAGGVLHNVLQVAALPSGAFEVSFVLNATEPLGAAQPLIIYLDGHSSYPTTLPVASPAGLFPSSN